MHPILTEIKKNWKAGVTVSLVSIPLSISLAVAANATPVMGVVTALWAGIFAAAFGGSAYNIVGPTGALSGLLAIYAIQFGLGVLPVLAVLSGVMILIAYALRWERYISFIPSSVVHGFTFGVAWTIALNQLNSALGLSGLPQHERFISNVMESFRHIGSTDGVSLLVFVVGLGLLFLLMKYVPRIPGAIILALIGIGIGYAGAHNLLPFALQTLQGKYGSLTLQIITLPSLGWNMLNPQLGTAAAAIALIAILETLISAKIADGMTKTKSDQHKELLGLGLANIASGLAGGIPATAALARTSLNVKVGATSRMAGIINAVMVALISLVLLSWFQYLPMPIIASILVYVAIRMIEVHEFKRLWSFNRSLFWLAMVVAVICVVDDPIMGILAGAAVALLMFVYEHSKGHAEVFVNRDNELVTHGRVGSFKPEEHKGEVVVYRMSGELTYLNADAHRQAITELGSCHTVVISLRNVHFADLDGLLTLEDIVNELEADGKKVILTGVNDHSLPVLAQSDWYHRFSERGRTYTRTSMALSALGFHLR